jgi:hypothetical protein
MEHFEKHGTFWEKVEHFEKTRVFFLRKTFFFRILPFTLAFALSFATWTFWEKWSILRNTGYFFEKHIFPTGTLGEPVWKTLPIPFLRASASVKTFEKFMYQVWMGFYLHTHKCHSPAKQVQSDRLPSVSGDVTSGTQKMLKKGICKRHCGCGVLALLSTMESAPGSLHSYIHIYKHTWFTHIRKSHLQNGFPCGAGFRPPSEAYI